MANEIPTYAGQLIKRPLDANGPDLLIVSPSVNRMAPDGPLAHTIGSLQRLISTDKMGSDALVFISDGSNGPDAEQNRLTALNLLDMGEGHARLIFRTPGLREADVEHVTQRTGIRPDVVRAALNGLGYGAHRETVDNDIRAYMEARGGRPLAALTLDDDIRFPNFQVAWSKNGLAPHGLEPLPNSQVMSPYSAEANGFPVGMFDVKEGNSIQELFAYLGKTVGEMKQQYPHMRATAGMTATENNALQEAVRGKTSQLEFTHGEGPDLESADEYHIVGSSMTKTDRTDASTYQTALSHLSARLPDNHMAVESYRSGPSERFAIRGSNSIYPDSSVFARYFDESTAYWNWWFTTSLDISLQNKLGSVDGHYRADNDRLPHMLNTVFQVLGQKYVYALGFDTEAFHSRTNIGGNRQDLHKGVMSSMVGNIAAIQSVKRMVLDRETGLLKIDRHGLVDSSGQPDPNYRVPVDPITNVDPVQLTFDRMINLIDVSRMEVARLELEMQNVTGDERSKKQELVVRYNRGITDMSARIGGPDLNAFAKHINPEIRDQLIFYADLVDATPKIVDVLQQRMRDGEYMVEEYVREPQSSINYPTK